MFYFARMGLSRGFQKITLYFSLEKLNQTYLNKFNKSNFFIMYNI